MEKIVDFQKKEPVYCAQDLRDYIGWVVEDIISDKDDCNVQVVLKNMHSSKKAVIDIDRALDGETLLVIHR